MIGQEARLGYTGLPYPYLSRLEQDNSSERRMCLIIRFLKSQYPKDTLVGEHKT